MTSNFQRSKLHQGGLNRTHQADSPVISEYTNLKKLLVEGRERRSILQDSVLCVLHIRSEVKLDTWVNSVLFHFTKGLVLRNAIQWWTTRLSTCSFCSQERNLHCQTISKNVLWGWSFKAFKMSGNWGYLIERPSDWQDVKQIKILDPAYDP